MQSGMDKFRRADVNGSLEDFDSAMALDPQLRPYLWQRGLSLYYAGTSQEQEYPIMRRMELAVKQNNTGTLHRRAVSGGGAAVQG